MGTRKNVPTKRKYMTMKSVTENGKVYQIDDNGLVVSASVATEPEVQLEFEVEPLSIHDRVEIAGRLGKIVSRIPSVYGDSIGVKFDDGGFDEFLASDLERTSEDPIYFDKPLDEVKAEWLTYQDMPEYTLEEVDSKAAVARRLNVVSKALVTDSQTPLSERVELDHIILATGTDLFDLRDKAERLNVESHSDYLASLPNYKMDSEFQPYQSRSREDVSWILAEADAARDELASLDWEKHLSDEALKATSRLSEDELSNDEFMKAVAGYREDTMPVGFDNEKRARFHALLETARESALAERKATHVAKTAAIKEDLDDFDASALFL